MKVYVIKNDKGQYQTPDMDYISQIWLADIFNDYEVAKCYCRSDCNVVECELIEKNELADHDKKVRAEVCDRFRKIALKYYTIDEKGNLTLTCNDMWDILGVLGNSENSQKSSTGGEE